MDSVRCKNNTCLNTTSGTGITKNMSFAKDVLPIFTSNCNGCHNAVAPSAGNIFINTILG